MRRRRTETSKRADHRQAPSFEPDATKSADNSEAEHIDEDEQKAIVAGLEKELMEQVAVMNGVFVVVCNASMLVSFLALAWEPTWLMLAHVLYGCAMFWIAQKHIVVEKGKAGVRLMILLLVVAIPFQPLIYNYTQTNDFVHVDLHWALAGVNVMLMVAAHLLRMDTLSHSRDLEELASSTYKYRSL